MSSGSRNPAHNPRPEVLLGDLSRRNYGVFCADEAQRMGITKHQLGRLVRAGFLLRPLPRVYALAAVAPSWRQELAAARSWAGPDVAFSYGTAARLWRIRGFDSAEPIEMTACRYLRSPSSRISVHRVRSWCGGDLCQLDGLPLTTPTRTIIDFAAAVSPAVLRDALDEVLVRELTTWRDCVGVSRIWDGMGEPGLGPYSS